LKRWDIRTRVLIAAVAPAILIALALASYFTYVRLAALDRELHEHGNAIARQLAPAYEYGVFSGNNGFLRQLAETAVRDAGVDGVAIADKDGVVLVRSGTLNEDAVKDMTPPELLRLRTEFPAALVFLAPVGRPRREPGDPFEVEKNDKAPAPEAIGSVLVQVSLAPLEARKNELIIAAALITLAGLLVAAGIARRLSQDVVRPVLQLASTVDSIKAGRLDTRASIEAGGVLKVLESGINAMAASLEAAQRDLEKRVTTATAELQRQKEVAELANRTKTQFLAAASHDLRQPIQAAGLFVSALQLRAKDEETKRLVSRVERALGGLEAVLDGLLDISRLDAGAVTARVESFPVSRTFSGLRDAFAAAAQEAGLTLRFAASSAWCVSDPLLLERVLSNLVSNALRYTVSGGVLVGCRRRGADLRIDVCDTGCGIPEDKRDQVFREFVQLGNAAHARDKGLGLGLAIVDRLSRLLGHAVSFRSSLGKGTVFSIIVPRAQPPRQSDAAAVATNCGGDLQGWRLLVVDDDAEVLESLDAFLSQLGATVITASSAAEASTAAMPGEGGIDAILSDYRLPDGDGVAVIEQLRRDAGRPIPAIVITGEMTTESLQRVRERDLMLLHKPVSAEALRAALLGLRNAEGAH